jgi:hypothetical protein
LLIASPHPATAQPKEEQVKARLRFVALVVALSAFALLPAHALGAKAESTKLGFSIETLNPGSLKLTIESQVGKCEKQRQIEIRDLGNLLFLGEAGDGEVISTPGVGSEGSHQIVATAEQKKVKVKGKKVTCKAATYDDGPYSIG